MIDKYSLEKFMQKFNIIRKPMKKKFEINPMIVDTSLRAMVFFLLISIDFLLFTGSGNINLFNGWIIAAEVFYVLLLFAFATALIFGLIAKRLMIQNILVAAIVYFFIFALYNQFAQFDYKGFIGGWFGATDGILGHYSDSIAAVIFALIAYCFFSKNNRIQVAYVTFLVFLLFCGILMHDLTHYTDKNEFFVSYNNQEEKADKKDGQKVVYLFLPNASSTQYIKDWKDTPDAQKTVDIINAFYAKNNFTVYPNAYVDDNNQFLNMVSLLNTQRDNDPMDNILKTKLLYQYWKFFNLKDEYIYLKRNDLFQTFKNSGYKISAYKSHGFDLCHQKHKINVDRCVEKITKPIKIWDEKTNSFKQSKVMFAEWLDSTGIFNNLAGAYKTVSFFSDADSIPLVGINYRNLYVVSSVRTLDRLLKDIQNDSGNQAYFVFMDIPSDMYTYDEFCRIKPQNEWISLVDLPWVKNNKEAKKKTAYLKQTQCLFGKLEEFMQNLRKLGLTDKTTVIIQGISGFEENVDGKSAPFIKHFTGAQLINMAIKEPSAEYYSENMKICPATNIINNFLYGNNLCRDLEGLNVHMSIKREIFNKLSKNNLSDEYLHNTAEAFDRWYIKWLKNSKNNTAPEPEIENYADDTDDEEEGEFDDD